MSSNNTAQIRNTLDVAFNAGSPSPVSCILVVLVNEVSNYNQLEKL